MTVASVQRFTWYINATILAMVFGLMAFFYVCGYTFLVWFSIPAALVYVIGFFLIHKAKLTIYVRMIYSWLTFYMCVTTICLGYNYGFHLYCFSIIPTIFVSGYISYKLYGRRDKAMYPSLAIAAAYMVCTCYVGLHGPIYETNAKAAAFFWFFNAASVFFFLIFYSRFLIESIIDSEDKLIEAAHVDRLTGLYNRHYMLDRLSKVPESAAGFLAMIDIDNFKKINDTYGHNGGDEVLRAISGQMKKNCENCVISRWGGEEFLILSEAADTDGRELLEHLRQTIEQSPVPFEEQDIRVTITIGMAAQRSERTIDEWVQDADSKLYFGKNNGKNRVVTEL